MKTGDPTPRALDGVKVLDLTRFMAGPYATIVLSDHGADVVKVESLPAGDPTRQSGVDYVGDENALFLMWNRGKRDIALDLRQPAGLEIIRRLVAASDVFVENYRPGVADSIGVGYDELSAINPRLVYCSVTAYGSQGPMASYPGTDPVVQAVSGVMSLTGEAGQPPVLVGVPVADFTGSMLAVQGIALALYARERTGHGDHIEVSMLDGMLTMLSTRLATYWASGETPGPVGSAHSTLVPYQVFETADDPVMAGSIGPDSWPRFCDALGVPEVATDPRFRTNVDRMQHRETLLGIVADAFRTRTAEDWEQRFRAAGALFAQVMSVPGILADPHVASSGFVQTVDHPTLGPIPQLGPLVKLGRHAPRISRPPPLFGEHTREILESVGYGAAEIDALAEAGVVVAAPAPAGRGS